ncbi:MAG: hypothetical protein JSS82_00155 [Bacteroidetes bacterium]|nr:hypothetical protein [Bacteroidota bacterium]
MKRNSQSADLANEINKRRKQKPTVKKQKKTKLEEALKGKELPKRTLTDFGISIRIAHRAQTSDHEQAMQKQKKVEQEEKKKREEDDRNQHIPVPKYRNGYGFDVMTVEERLTHEYQRFNTLKRDPIPDPLADDFIFYPDSYSYESRQDSAPIIIEHALSVNGNSVTVRATGMEARFYVGMPLAWLNAVPRENHKELAIRLHKYMRFQAMNYLKLSNHHYGRYAKFTRLINDDRSRIGHVILPLTEKELAGDVIDYKTHDMFGYRGNNVHVPTLKITVAAPQLVPYVRELFWNPYGSASDLCYLCSSTNPFIANRKHCWQNEDDPRTVEDAMNLLRERHANCKFVREKQKDLNDAEKGNKKNSSKLLFGVSKEQYVPENTYEIREKFLQFHHDVVKHHNDCPARFHGQCMRFSAMAFRIACPFETLEDTYFARCPFCYSDYTAVYPAKFEKYVPPTYETQEESDDEEEDDHYNDTAESWAVEEQNDADFNEFLCEDDGDRKPKKGGKKSRKRSHFDRNSKKVVRPYENWCRPFRVGCKDLTIDKKPLPNAEHTEMPFKNEQYFRSKFGVIRVFPSFTVYNADVQFIMVKIIDEAHLPCEHYMVPKGKYRVIPADHYDRKTYADIEIECYYKDMIPLKKLYPPETPADQRTPEWNKMNTLMNLYPTMNVLSVDMEMMTVNDRFPVPEENEIIQIINVIYRPDTREMSAVLFTLKDISVNPRVRQNCPLTVISFDTEYEVLYHQCLLTEIIQPKRIAGHNIKNFDIPYFVARCHKLNVKKGRSFLCIRKGCSVSWRPGSSGKKRDLVTYHEGTIAWDTYPICKEYKAQLPQHNLQTVSRELLGDVKVELPYSLIPMLQQTADGRARLAAYTYYDGILPILILQKLEIPIFMRNLCRNCSTPEEQMLSNGLECRIVAYNRAACIEMMGKFGDASLPLFPTKRAFYLDPNVDFSKKKAKYDGALVENPEVRTYPHKIAKVLDFQSLYPSVMIKENFCYSNFVFRCVAEELGLQNGVNMNIIPDRKFHRTSVDGFIEYNIVESVSENSPAFVTPEVQNGITPVKLSYFKQLRSQVKKVQESLEEEVNQMLASGITADSFGETIKQKKERAKSAELQQLVFKLIGNSTYGIFGQEREFGRWSLPALAYAVTASGKFVIVTAQQVTQKTFCKANGWPFNLRVVYIDTDSTFDMFFDDMDYDYSQDPIFCFNMLDFMGAFMTNFFKSKLFMTPEKIYMNGITFFGPKMYIGTHVEKFKKPYTELKGCSGIRRDTIAYVARAVKTVCGLILARDYDEVMRVVVEFMREILTGEVPLYMMSSTGSFKRNFLDQNCVTFTKAMSAAMKQYTRDGTVVMPGTRVRFITVEEPTTEIGKLRLTTSKQQKVTLRTEMLYHAIKNDMQYDRMESVQRLCSALEKPMVPMVIEMESHRISLTPESAKKMLNYFWKEQIDRIGVKKLTFKDQGIMNFMNHDYQNRCMNCNAVLDNEPLQKKDYIRSRKIHYDYEIPRPQVVEHRSGYEVIFESFDLPNIVRQNRPDMMVVTVSDKIKHGLMLCNACMVLKSNLQLEQQTTEPRLRLVNSIKSNVGQMVRTYSACRICSGDFISGKNVKDCSASECDKFSMRHTYAGLTKRACSEAQWLNW